MLMEDLTAPTRKLLAAAKESPDMEFAFMKEVIIMANKKQVSFMKVQNADDLFHLGMEEVGYDDFYACYGHAE